MGDEIWTSKDIILAVIATGLVSALAGWVKDAMAERARRKHSARYGAMRCAVEFERYAAECWNVINMSEGHFQMTKLAYSDALPPAPALPSEINWELLDARDVDEVMSFLTTCKLAESEAGYAKQFENNPYDFDEAARSLGGKALSIATRLRADYALSRSPEMQRLSRLSPADNSQVRSA